ncbi:MAG: DNA replication and repair protein RecF [Vicinamibacteria bacterium]|nr:DNA replication and repair protein RecF [Vicinamibacteria bacterium]
MWIERLLVRDLRNIAEAECALGPGLNVFHGANAQGKTSLLEAAGLVARARSFRTDDLKTVVRRGQPSLRAQATAVEGSRRSELEVELGGGRRALRVEGRPVTATDYHGRLEVAVYATDRLRVIRGSMRDRRQFLDRSAGALWPAYRRLLAENERVAAQRGAALERRSGDRFAWDERLLEHGTALRVRRATYARRLHEALQDEYRPGGETYALRLSHPEEDPAAAHEQLQREIETERAAEQASGRMRVGPQRDRVVLEIAGADAVEASSGQVRSLLLGLTLAVLALHRQETGHAAVALLDDLDSELDEERASLLCERVCAHGQALVTTAHPGWARRVARDGRLFAVEQGRVLAA